MKYTYTEPHTPEDDVTGCPACDASTEKVCVGAEACATHDDAGRRYAFNCPPEETCEVGTEACSPSKACPLSPISKANHCNYWKTAATDGCTGPAGGTNSVECHTCGPLRGTRWDIYSSSEGKVAYGP